MIEMLNLNQLPALAILNLEAFPAGDLVRKRAMELGVRARLSGKFDTHGEEVRRAGERLARPEEWLSESLRWVWLPNGSLKNGIGEFAPSSVEYSNALASLVEQGSSPEVRDHNRAVVRILESLHSACPKMATAAIEAVARAAPCIHATSLGRATSISRVGDTGHSAIPALLAIAHDAAHLRADPRLTSSVGDEAERSYAFRLLQPALVQQRGLVSTIPIQQLRLMLAACDAADHAMGCDGELRNYLLEPVLERVEHSIETYEKRLRETKTKVEFEAFTKEMREHLDPDVDLLSAAADNAGVHAIRLRDSYADLIRTFAIRGCNDFKMFGAADSLFARAAIVAASSALRDRLANDAKQASENAAHGNCVYCKTEEADGKPAGVAMFKVTERNLTSTRYSSGTIQVPRCKTCQSQHATQDALSSWLLITLIVIGALIGLAQGGVAGLFGGGCAGLIAGGILSFIIGVIWSFRFRGSPNDFPPIQKLLSEGRKFGDSLGKHD